MGNFFSHHIRRLLATDNLKQTKKDISTIKHAALFHSLIEDCQWLKNKSFAPGGWALDYAALYTLFCILNFAKPKNILEFGLGQSSKMIHQYAGFFQSSRALTIEHDKNWRDFFLNSVSGYEIKTALLQLETVEINGFKTQTYINIDELYSTSGDFDFVLIDGPQQSPRYSRSQILNLVQKFPQERFVYLFDDSERPGEQDTIKSVCSILKDKGINYHSANITGDEKFHAIICSEDLKFLTSIRY
ncbi:MAG: hypothetical protein LBJ14_10150 [Desulfarculales bacterium]|jgi:hypothetical protein|nr:hypothetical protein [Desulfarculales bacterium]